MDLFELQWPRDNLYLACYAHEILNYRYHWHQSEYEIDILLKGKQEFCCGKESFMMEADDVVFVNPREGHASFSRQEDTLALVLRFSSSVFRPILKKGEGYYFPGIRSDERVRNHTLYRKIRFYCAQILASAKENDPISRMAVKGSMELLVYTLYTMGNPQISKAYSERNEQQEELFFRLLQYIEKHYAEKITLDDLAGFSQYNRTYISTLFKNTVGINFYEYLTRVRFQRAVFELATTDKNLTQVALDNGFADLKSLNGHFREILHYSPAEYRNRISPDCVIRELHTRRLISPENDFIQKKLREYRMLPKLPE